MGSGGWRQEARLGSPFRKVLVYVCVSSVCVSSLCVSSVCVSRWNPCLPLRMTLALKGVVCMVGNSSRYTVCHILWFMKEISGREELSSTEKTQDSPKGQSLCKTSQ